MTFLRSTLSSALGTLVAGIFLFIFILVVGISIVASAGSKDEVAVKDHSILKIALNGEIHEKGSQPFEVDPGIPFLSDLNKVGLYDIREAIKKAKVDERIDGIYLTADGINAGWATLEGIHEALIDFKESGKFIYAYSEIYTEKSYYLASLADESYIYPQGGMMFDGLATTPMFFKGMFDKLGIEAKVFRVGTFKSAIEPFIGEKMSEANRLQTNVLIGDIWGEYLRNLAEAKGMDQSELNGIADSMLLENAADAVAMGLIDDTKYEDEVLEMLKEKTEAKSTAKIKFISLNKYMKAHVPDYEKKRSKNKVAVIFAEGAIVDGKGESDQIGSVTLVKMIRKVREDSSFKALVLRVNSPGGSALASDVIWRELSITKEKKPVIVSMGDLAASGGYYISCNADKIFAEPYTITGSIGVFGLMFNTQDLFNEKFGITFDKASTNPYADIGNPNREMSDFEAKKIQNSVNEIYGVFINKVMEGRGFPDSLSVDKIAQGRVWTGIRGKELGLVDEIGNLQDAIAYAVEMAELEEDYMIRTYPEDKDPVQEIMEAFGLEAAVEHVAEQKLSEELKIYKKMKSMIARNGVYMLMPQEYDIK